MRKHAEYYAHATLVEPSNPYIVCVTSVSLAVVMSAARKGLLADACQGAAVNAFCLRNELRYLAKGFYYLNCEQLNRQLDYCRCDI